MVVDGCFVLEILRVTTAATQTRGSGALTYHPEARAHMPVSYLPRSAPPPQVLQPRAERPAVAGEYADNDPIFSKHGVLYIVPYLKRDMLMLENQLPLLVLEKLVAVQNDIFIKDIIRSATELNEAGICIKWSKSRSLKDITFRGGVLRLPLIVVDDALESLYLNLIAFERFHVGAGNDLTSYIFFMDNIIDNSLDVSLLHSCGIIQNALDSDKAVAKLFNSLSKDITLDPESYLEQVHKQRVVPEAMAVAPVESKPYAHLLTNPWAILSVIAAAIFLFALTIVQTIYGVLSYTNPPA
ncbi:hypothetical protein SASPL_157524 [Salvia splendens]|uniref:Uncharacterized protein n=1 Tax=Salvia splendens TaxID=180675 RepID=A0A8X8VUX4_SALSN|nr:hypothetical protein SASPL_157524 [Salvia splendens]